MRGRTLPGGQGVLQRKGLAFVCLHLEATEVEGAVVLRRAGYLGRTPRFPLHVRQGHGLPGELQQQSAFRDSALWISGGSHFSVSRLLNYFLASSLWSCQDSPGAPGGMCVGSVESYPSHS